MAQDLALVGDGDLGRPHLVGAEAGRLTADRLQRRDLDGVARGDLDRAQAFSRAVVVSPAAEVVVSLRLRWWSLASPAVVLVSPPFAAASGDDEGKDTHEREKL